MNRPTFLRRSTALLLTLVLMVCAALPGFAAYQMPIQTASDTESVYLFLHLEGNLQPVLLCDTRLVTMVPHPLLVVCTGILKVHSHSNGAQVCPGHPRVEYRCRGHHPGRL